MRRTKRRSKASASAHRRQHYIPQSYLRAWCDPDTPDSQTPYVWVFSADGRSVRRKSPANLFHETDTYTLTAPDGSRNLVLEHGLAELEGLFCRVRDEKLVRGAPLSADDDAVLKAFIAAMHARTPAQREHQRSQWGELLDMAEHMAEAARRATPAQRRAMSLDSDPADRRHSFGLDELREVVRNPMQAMFRPQFEAMFSLLLPLDLLVLQTTIVPGFITSDAPCVWFDPEGYKRPPMLQGPALVYSSIEITLPVSPSLLVVLNRRGVRGYGRARDVFVDSEANRRTRAYAREHFVVNANVKRDVWFELREEPADSWRKQHAEPSS